MYYVYILLCKNGSLYTGIAQDVEDRFARHKAKKGAKYTRAFAPIKILYKQRFLSKSKALRREIQIKGLCREEKMSLIKLNSRR